MPAGLRSDPAGGKAFVQVDGVDVLELTPAGAEAALFTQGGSPIVESGSNADGDYVRYADGTQVCYGYGGYALSGTWTFPAAFTGAPTPTFSSTRSDGSPRYFGVNSSTMTGSSLDWTANNNAGARIIAFGRWK